MGSRKLLIVGIDPGTTAGFAVLDIEGNLIYLDSSKQLNLNILISNSVSHGKVILVGTDKAKIPNLVREFSAKLGARVVNPSEDLKVIDKKSMASEFSVQDEHQADALASALFAYKSAKPLLDKIDIFVSENKKEAIKNLIKELVISKRISIKSAVSIIEKKDDNSKIIEKVVVQKELNENDFLRLYSQVKAYESEIKLIKNYNNSLRNKLTGLEKNPIIKARKNISRAIDDFREKRLKNLGNSVKNKDTEIEHLKMIIRNLNSAISNIKNLYVLKKLDSLGINEFNFKNKILNVQKNDFLLVDDPNIVSDSLVELLKNNVLIIVYRKQVSKKIESSLPFIFVSSKNLKFDEDKYFGFVEKRQFDMEKDRIGWAAKIISDYRKEKQQLFFG